MKPAIPNLCEEHSRVANCAQVLLSPPFSHCIRYAEFRLRCDWTANWFLRVSSRSPDTGSFSDYICCIGTIHSASKNFVTAEEKYEAPPLGFRGTAPLRQHSQGCYHGLPGSGHSDREVLVAVHYTVEGETAAVTAGLGINRAFGFLTTVRWPRW